MSTTSRGRPARYGVGVEIHVMSLSDATGTPRCRRMSRASRRVGRVDMSEEDEDEGDGAAGAMPRLLARSSIALAPGVVRKDDGGGRVPSVPG